MISKNKINQISKQFKNLEDNYLMGIVYNIYLKDLRVDTVIPDTLSKGDMVVFDYTDNIRVIYITQRDKSVIWRTNCINKRR